LTGWRGSNISRPKTLVIHHTALENPVQADLLDKAHAKEGYPESHRGENVCYHFLVGMDGTVKQTSSLQERRGCTRNGQVNLESIQIVAAGNFEKSPPNPVQLRALEKLIKRLDAIYHFERIIGHTDASPTVCPGKHLLTAIEPLLREPVKTEVWNVTRYYSPVLGQTRYYRTGKDAYKRDVEMNCGLYSPEQLAEFRKRGKKVYKDGMLEDGTYGDCVHAAYGRLEPQDAMKVAACPPEIPFGTKFNIQGIGVVTCRDRGGAIQGRRLDVWAGFSEEGLQNINKYPGGYLTVTRL
jgi:3D (Asp-Asp-Asp) domain-containing protein